MSVHYALVKHKQTDMQRTRNTATPARTISKDPRKAINRGGGVTKLAKGTAQTKTGKQKIEILEAKEGVTKPAETTVAERSTECELREQQITEVFDCNVVAAEEILKEEAQRVEIMEREEEDGETIEKDEMKETKEEQKQQEELDKKPTTEVVVPSRKNSTASLDGDAIDKRRMTRGDSQEVRLEEILTRVFIDLPPSQHNKSHRSPSPRSNPRSVRTPSKPESLQRGPKSGLPRPPAKKAAKPIVRPPPVADEKNTAAAVANLPKKAPLPQRPPPLKTSAKSNTAKAVALPPSKTTPRLLKTTSLAKKPAADVPKAMDERAKTVSKPMEEPVKMPVAVEKKVTALSASASSKDKLPPAAKKAATPSKATTPRIVATKKRL